MKRSRCEKLSEHLSNVDEELLANAHEIDDAKKLRQYIKAKNAKSPKPFYQSPVFRKTAVVAACFLVIMGMLFSIPALFIGGNTEDTNERNDPRPVTPPSINKEEEAITIHSIAELNYYAALHMLSEESRKVSRDMTSLHALDTSNKAVMLSAAIDIDTPDTPPTPETTAHDKEDPDTPDTPTAPNPDEDIYYYALDPDEPFYIDRVTMFQIELTDENGFLASKLGLGTVDVVITEDCIWGESMITFRSGDRFFSCLTNGGGYDPQAEEWRWDFSTHKYVEGFFIVKNLSQENYGFRIQLNAESQAYAFNCYETEKGGNRVDQNVRIVSTTEVSEEGRHYTVAELEAYFNTDNMPNENEPDETLPLPEST